MLADSKGVTVGVLIPTPFVCYSCRNIGCAQAVERFKYALSAKIRCVLDARRWIHVEIAAKQAVVTKSEDASFIMT